MNRSHRAAYVTLAGCLALAMVPGAHAVPSSSRTATAPAAAVKAVPVLPAAKTEGVATTPAGVQKALAAALGHPSLGNHPGAIVYDVSRGRQLYAKGAGTTYVPASTLKVLTTLGSLAALGPDHKFTTKVVSTGGTSLVLVGGGDPLLVSRRPKAPGYPKLANLPDLASATAKALKAKKVASVTVGYDASLFSGPAINHKWQPNYVPEGIAGPTSALWVDQGRNTPGLAKRAASPSQAAARKFVAALLQLGIKANLGKPVKAPATASLVAQVQSPPLSAVAGYVNLHSDNDGAEVLLRHIGLGIRSDGSYQGGIAALRTTLTRLGLTLGAARIEDGSGLSRTNAVPLSLLAGALRLAADPAHPELRSLLPGLPVAAFNGSLAERFITAGTAAGQGYVRAKTGTLTGVHSLAGFVRTRSGTMLAFVVATDSVQPSNALEARAALDRAAAALAACGCA
ncbi:D-alanyl-D-alanine carboxypeptidase/D-alanyl-D-alanine endopeptidase [Kribbella deserti]|uniref:D-alanyl-D-alanine carboxypeptidase/D-alanyl-D-alanine-endopeptidase n=1 Tax=Kribbella deserti TaxID=1926257 RepID=A0ABV6QQQ5_9ACTN